jgi:PKD repeat protein
MRLRTWAQRGGSRTTSNYYIYFYGADIEIEYTEASGDKVYIKSNGSWVEVAHAYKKVNGSWVEQTDLSTLFDDTKPIIQN